MVDPTIIAMMAQEAMKLIKGEAPPDPGSGAAGPGIDMAPAFQQQAGAPGADPSKINESILQADGQTPPPSIAIPSVEAGTGPLPQGDPVITAGSTGDFSNISGTGQAPTDDLDVVQIPGGPPGGGGDPSKMGMEEKMAIAAQVGSLMRGPAPPRPPSVGAGPGINMQPVFLKDLRG